MSAAWRVVGRGRMGRAFLALGVSNGISTEGVGARDDVPERTDPAPLVWIIAVTDQAIAAVCERLAPSLRAGDVVLHLAGARGLEVLAAASLSGASVGALHPLAAIATREPPGSLHGAAFLIEGDAAAVAVAREIAALAQGRLIEAIAVDRARYHAGAALVASGAVALAQGAAWLLGGAIDPAPSDDDLRAATASLLVSVARNIQRVGADAALASPLLRDDTVTVAKHLAVMGDETTVQRLYRAVLLRVLVPLERSGRVSAETIRAARALAEGPPNDH